MTVLELMRTYPPGQPHYSLMYCPMCDCNKSGNVRVPNRYSDACQDDECRCHYANVICGFCGPLDDPDCMVECVCSCHDGVTPDPLTPEQQEIYR